VTVITGGGDVRARRARDHQVATSRGATPMENVILLLIVLVTAILVYRRNPERYRDALRAVTRQVRVRTGAYDLKEVVYAAVEAIEARAVPSVSTTYLPNRAVVGLHRDDADRFGGLLSDIATEIAEIVVARARGRSGVTLVGGTVHVTIVRDPEAAPGRPTVGARLARREDAPTSVIGRDVTLPEGA
jgi:hypothetical protein